MKQVPDNQLISPLNGMELLYLITAIEYYDCKIHINSIMFNYMDFEMNNQLN